jgi:RNA recognition motif-containing protein
MTSTISESVADQTAASPTTTVQSGPTVFVGNLSFSTTAEQVTELFGAEKV